MEHALLYPVLSLMLLTLLVWVYMYALRLRYLVTKRIPSQQIATPERINAMLPEHINRPSNNLKNLFELPVIFYATCSLLLALHHADAVFVQLAWAYVALRALHSAIQCTINHVPLRFTAYLASSIVLWAMVIRLALSAI
ncbi:MAPEG family protein [Crenobacter sp. SG2303]|uniref:MAPEG family protein n=1 Tax=Crenobacter oryzisoli TaxID=3056844 RepID=A0ABT7XV33_9NEIS|nr:MAPEG family protein [Crenobacter sp. SG2303]MDN0077590.1 MAPEG family protein [Crenobacter sp. SG2303]